MFGLVEGDGVVGDRSDVVQSSCVVERDCMEDGEQRSGVRGRGFGLRRVEKGFAILGHVKMKMIQIDVAGTTCARVHVPVDDWRRTERSNADTHIRVCDWLGSGLK